MIDVFLAQDLNKKIHFTQTRKTLIWGKRVLFLTETEAKQSSLSQFCPVYLLLFFNKVAVANLIASLIHEDNC